MEIARRLVEEGVGSVARDGESEGQHRQDHRVASGGASLALGVPDDALGDAEAGHLRVDVGAGADDGVEAHFVGFPEEGGDVLGLVALAEIEVAGRHLVDRPGDVDVDEPNAEGLCRGEARLPVRGVEAEVVNRAGVEGDDLSADLDPAGDKAKAP